MNYTATVKTGKETQIRENKKRKAGKCRVMALAAYKLLGKIKAELCSADESASANALNIIAIIGAVTLAVICIAGAVLVADFIASLLFGMSAAALLLLMLELYLVNKHDSK